MDLYCPRCGEPWDIDSLREEAMTWKITVGEVFRNFRTYGCSAVGERCSDRTASPLIREIYELMGNDLDGAAIELSDLAESGELFEEVQ